MNSKKILVILLFIIAAIMIIGSYFDDNNSSDSNYKNTNVTNDSRVYSKSWRSPTSEEMIKIGTLLVQNKIKICGEYHVKEITNNEFVIACTPDGNNWTYYTLWPNVNEKVYLVTEEMENKLKPPY